MGHSLGMLIDTNTAAANVTAQIIPALRELNTTTVYVRVTDDAAELSRRPLRGAARVELGTLTERDAAELVAEYVLAG